MESMWFWCVIKRVHALSNNILNVFGFIDDMKIYNHRPNTTYCVNKMIAIYYDEAIILIFKHIFSFDSLICF